MKRQRAKTRNKQAMVHSSSGRSPDSDSVPSGAVPNLVFNGFFIAQTMWAGPRDGTPVRRPRGGDGVSNHR